MLFFIKNTLHHQIQGFQNQYLCLDQRGLEVVFPFFPVTSALVLRSSLSGEQQKACVEHEKTYSHHQAVLSTLTLE